VVEHWPHHPKVEVVSPVMACGAEIEERAKAGS